MQNLETFDAKQIAIVNNGAAMAEELVSNFYKMSASQWLRRRYDIKTLADITPEETVDGPFAQIIRYRGQRKDALLGSSGFDFYKICLQDHSILAALRKWPFLQLLPFIIYIVTHELIHIVRFSKFIQNFDASPQEMLAEETRVHEITHEILLQVRVPDLPEVLKFYERWRRPIDGLRNM
ncbi:MAG: hypothetical protein KKH68_09500 [Proteobacteria bacterium]|nr:hypothetical protein [Pseudomonadota bacterium]